MTGSKSSQVARIGNSVCPVMAKVFVEANYGESEAKGGNGMTDLFNDSGAIISACGTYRYHLWRRWDETLPIMVFVMQNPSTADAVENDPTIRKCMHFARRDGFGGISVRNVFALRATDERELLRHPDPVGPENELHLLSAREVCLMSRIVLAWGKPFGGKALAGHYKKALAILGAQKPYCLGVNNDGSPKHPLFLANATELVAWGRGRCTIGPIHS